MSSPDYQDATHRPHAHHDGEVPRNEIKEAPYHLTVTLDTWGPVENLFPAIYDALQANWGDKPSRTTALSGLALSRAGTDCRYGNGLHEAAIWSRVGADKPNYWEHGTGWCLLSDEKRAYVESCFSGKTLQQVLERITFNFLVDECSRATTHQLVRTRLGAGMMQHGGRDNDWRHRPWILPETIRRACERAEGGTHNPERQELKHCITDWKPIKEYLERTPHFDGFPGDGSDPSLRGAIEQYLDNGRQLYAALVDAGIPWEDARRLLWMGTATYIHIDYNYLALRGVLMNRLEHVMDWEINCVAQLMLREVRMKCPPLFSKYLGSASDLAGVAKFAGLQSWPPDGKYPNPYERCACGHAKANHHVALTGFGYCDACDHDRGFSTSDKEDHRYVGVDTLAREHRPEQNPFWVLDPQSMAGAPIKWIATNGTYPQELKK